MFLNVEKYIWNLDKHSNFYCENFLQRPSLHFGRSLCSRNAFLFFVSIHLENPAAGPRFKEFDKSCSEEISMQSKLELRNTIFTSYINKLKLSLIISMSSQSALIDDRYCPRWRNHLFIVRWIDLLCCTSYCEILNI